MGGRRRIDGQWICVTVVGRTDVRDKRVGGQLVGRTGARTDRRVDGLTPDGPSFRRGMVSRKKGQTCVTVKRMGGRSVGRVVGRLDERVEHACAR